MEIELDTPIRRGEWSNCARATCYYLLCVRYGTLLEGRKIIPERIREDRAGYEAALRASDEAWEDGHLDFIQMEAYLAKLAQAQVEDDGLDQG